MIFKSIRLKEGFFERAIIFSEGVNLIHSEKNSCGKTTLLRFMLYALGYNIPNTRKIKFDRCEVELVIECETVGEILLLRHSDIAIEATVKDQKRTFVLPEQQNDLHTIIFGTENVDILGNLLGAFYVDQEKGWTLLNRGVVIGSIHFKIEELIRGLSDCDCSELIRKEAQLSREMTKYKQMFSVAQYRETLDQEAGELVTDSYEEESDVTVNQLLLRKKRLKSELRRIDNTLSDNRRFKKFVADMKLLVQAPDGSTFPVTENNIVGLNDAIDLLIAKRKMVSKEFATVSGLLDRIEKDKDKEYEQLEFYKSASQLEIFDKRIARMPMNPVTIDQEIKRLDKEIKSIRTEINNITRNNNSVVSAISKNVIKYAEELGLGNKETIPASYLFTSNLKELSGAVLHKTAFAFRLAYITVIEDTLRIVREAREEAERKRVEEARCREENRQRKEQEIRLVKELVNKAEDYRIAKEIREYIQAMIDSGNEDITPEWIEWALKKADWYDPSIETEDEYLGKRQHEKSAEEKEKSLQDSIRKSWYW